jgi:(p)ppGpp synthase/HD superfamily hydrolase
MPLFSGRFQSSGRVFISHVIGTASILASLRLPAQVVAAGLLHNVYEVGDFGDGKTGISKAKRGTVRRAVGREGEEYVARFATLRWNSRTILATCDEPTALGPIDRGAVLLRLADHLEHLLAFDVPFYKGFGGQRYTDGDHAIVRLAERLGFPTLAAEIERAMRDTTLAEISRELHSRRGQARSSVIVPKSYRRRLSLSLRHLLARGLGRLRSAMKFSSF